MGRILWVLPLCLILQDQQVLPNDPPSETSVDTAVVNTKLTYILARPVFDSEEVVSALGAVGAAQTPAGITLPWAALFYQIGKKDLVPLENILKDQPLRFLQMCLDRYDRDIQGYTVLFCKQERVNGTLLKKERILVHFRQKPFSVHFNWEEGGGLAKKVFFLDGENDGKMRVRPVIGWIMTKDPEGAEAMRTSRFSIKQFGVRHGLQSTVNSIARAKDAGTLNVKYLGEFKVGQLNDRLCYKFVRTPYNPPEEDNINHYTFYIDVETWLHVGSELRNANGELIAEYYFRDLKPNAEFDKSIFSDKGL